MTTDADSSADSPAEFAADLRAMRLAAGSPTLTSLDRETGISKSVLSEAFSGRRLPSARTVDGLVRGCGQDPAEWLRRRDRIAAAEAVASAATVHAEPPSLPAEPPLDLEPVDATPPPTVRRRTAVWGMVAAALAGVLVTIGGYSIAGQVGASVAASSSSETPSAGGAKIAVAVGDDPAQTACVDDAAVVASEMRVENTKLEIIWSEDCHAAWARITRYDGRAAGNVVSASIFRQLAPTASDRQETTEPDAQGAYTTLILRPTRDTRICAVGSITVDGETIDLGDPVCL